MNILFGGEDVQKALVQLVVNEKAYPGGFPGGIVVREILSQAEDLALFADDQDVGFQDVCHDGADVIENEHLRSVVVQQLVDLPSLVQ